jgi:hypothetical protein
MSHFVRCLKYYNKTQFIRDRNSHYADAHIFNSCMCGFFIKNAHRLKHPIQFSGKLGFFEVDDSILLESR